MDIDEAKSFVLAELKQQFGETVQIVDSQTIEKPYGWVFFYNSKEFIETGNIYAALMSNAPLICTRDGRTYTLQMFCSVNEAVEMIEKEHSL